MNVADRKRSHDRCSGEWRSLAAALRSLAEEEVIGVDERAEIETAIADSQEMFIETGKRHRLTVMLADDKRW